MNEGNGRKHRHFYIRKNKAYIIIAVIAVVAGLIGGFSASKIFAGGATNERPQPY